MPMISGCINANGSIHSGSGFNPDKIGSGTYQINFDTPFQSTPAVALTQNYKDWEDFGFGGGNTRDNCVIVAVDKQKLKLVTGNSDGSHQDRNFCFIAIGD